jgi:hypothetical protein
MALPYDERARSYEARRAAGELHRNPFEGLIESLLAPAPPGTVAGAPTPGMGAGSPLDIPFAENLQQGRRAMFPSTDPNRVNTDAQLREINADIPVAGPMDTLREALSFVTPQGVAGETGSVIEDQGGEQGATVDLQEVVENPDTRKQASNKIYSIQRADLQQRGASEEALSGWDKFNEDYDLTTIGLALMSNQGGDLFSNLAQAMILGKQAKTAEKDKAAAGAAAARKEAREEREVRVKEFNARVNGLKARLDAAKGTADTGDFGLPTANAVGQVGAFVEEKLQEGGFGAEMSSDADILRLTMNYEEALRLNNRLPAGQRRSPNQVLNDVWSNTASVKDEFLSVGPTFTVR